MQKWEYKRVWVAYTRSYEGPIPGAVVPQEAGPEHHAEAEAVMNRLGSQGWELAGVAAHSPVNYMLFFKRPKS